MVKVPWHPSAPFLTRSYVVDDPLRINVHPKQLRAVGRLQLAYILRALVKALIRTVPVRATISMAARWLHRRPPFFSSSSHLRGTWICLRDHGRGRVLMRSTVPGRDQDEVQRNHSERASRSPFRCADERSICYLASTWCRHAITRRLSLLGHAVSPSDLEYAHGGQQRHVLGPGRPHLNLQVPTDSRSPSSLCLSLKGCRRTPNVCCSRPLTCKCMLSPSSHGCVCSLVL